MVGSKAWFREKHTLLKKKRKLPYPNLNQNLQLHKIIMSIYLGQSILSVVKDLYISNKISQNN